MEERIWIIIFVLCMIGCSVSIFCYGNWIRRQDKPVGFWANKPFEAGRIQDIQGYNREHGIIFQKYAPAPGLAGLAMLLGMEYAAIGILILWAVAGTFWLIRSYRGIEKKYIFS